MTAKTTTQKAATAKTTTKKAATKKVATKKAATTKVASAKTAEAPKPTVDLQRRYKMVEEAAYFLAEKDGFAGNPVSYWLAAEKQLGI